MKLKFTLAALGVAAAVGAGVYFTGFESSEDSTVWTETSPEKSGVELSEHRRKMRAAVKAVSVTPAYDIPSLADELTTAQEITDDTLNNKGFLSMVFQVTTKDGNLREVETVAFCNEFIQERNYQSACTEEIAWKIAATNSAYSDKLENHVATDNAEIRNHALVSLRWLRTAMSKYATQHNYHVVKEIRDIESPSAP